ncbi:Zn-ribbon domain-containing OB-fold protein [Solimonas soli]|jgi:uncharacterized OB-fold protein|uniref:Zn-ribbon domain-containing OB-fold protein n=1 Tax=Solimonas soli TaxID=413479 RepID=UPI00048618B1|nr:Zn-ribbon domain-containing OB-fold protein [Solimonas soli]
MSATLLPENEYQAFLRQGRFMIQRSASSGRYVFYPRAIAPGTGSEDLEWVEASGRGLVYSTTVVRAKPPTPSHNVALVQLEEGPRLMTRVEGIDPGEVRIDMPVKARIVQEADLAYVVFDPA